MAVIPVAQLKTGEKLSEQVYTNRGSLLFEKGIQITPREVEILKAFLIPSVVVETKGKDSPEQKTQKEAAESAAFEPVKTFEEEYENVLELLKKTFHLVRSGSPLPILEIRIRMEALLRQLDQYSILGFQSRNENVKDYLYHNSVMVSLTSYQLAKWNGFPAKDWMPVALGGLLHDIGNAHVDENLLEKKSKLTPAELEEVRKHTVYGYQILKNVMGLNEGTKMCTLQHHEREDGSGYPMGVQKEKIHPYAKIVAVADIYHAMTNHRHYKKAESPYLVLEQLHKEAFGKLDPVFVQVFIQKVTQFTTGTLVRLNDHRIGEIVFSDRNDPTRPWINMNGTIVNLTVERHLYIQEVLQ